MRMTLHYTGPLLEWFEGHAPEFFDTLSLLVERSRVEAHGRRILRAHHAGHTRAGRAGPDRLLHDLSRGEVSAVEAPGCVVHRAHIGIPASRGRSGPRTVEYTLLDDSHFLSAGLCPEGRARILHHGARGVPPEGVPHRHEPAVPHPLQGGGEIIEYLLRLRSRGGEDGHLRGRRREVRHVARDPHVGHRAGVAQEVLRRHAHGHGQDRGRAPGGRRGPVSVPRARLPAHGDVPGDDGWSLLADQGRYYEDLVKRAKTEHDWDRRRAFLRGGMWDNFLSKYRESNLAHEDAQDQRPRAGLRV